MASDARNLELSESVYVHFESSECVRNSIECRDQWHFGSLTSSSILHV